MLLAVVVIALPLLLCVLLQKRIELVLAPYVCGLILVCYGLALFQGLGWLTWLLLAAVAAAALALLLKALRDAKGQGRAMLRSLNRTIFTPGLCCLILVGGVFYLGSRSHYVIAIDDLNYWAIEVRSLYAQNGLVDAVHHLSPEFMTYTPGMQLFQWIGLTILGEWSEPILFFMLWLFYAIFLLPFTSFIPWRKGYWIPAFAVFILVAPTVMISKCYPLLQVDTALGILMGYALVQAWLLRKPGPDSTFTWICFILSLCLMILLKHMGAAWALMALFMLFFVSAPQRKGAKPFWLVAACLLPALVFGSWQLFCQVKGLSGIHLSRTSSHIQDILAGTWTLPEHMLSLPATLWTVFTASATELSYASGQWLELPRLFWIVFFIGLPILLVMLKKGHRQTLLRLSLALGITFVLFLLSYCFTLATTFYDEYYHFSILSTVGVLTQRYLFPYLFGAFLLFAWAALEGWTAAPRHSLPQKALYASLLALVVLCTGWSSVYDALFTVQPGHRWQDVLSSIQAENFWTDELEEPETAIVLYGKDSIDPALYPRIRYALGPAKILYCVDNDLTPQGLANILGESQVTHVICMDENNPLYRNATGFSEDEWLEPVTLYAVEWDGDSPVLEYY